MPGAHPAAAAQAGAQAGAQRNDGYVSPTLMSEVDLMTDRSAMMMDEVEVSSGMLRVQGSTLFSSFFFLILFFYPQIFVFVFVIFPPPDFFVPLFLLFFTLPSLQSFFRSCHSLFTLSISSRWITPGP